MRELAGALAVAMGSVGWLIGWGMILLGFALMFSSAAGVGFFMMLFGLVMRWLGRSTYRAGARIC